MEVYGHIFKLAKSEMNKTSAGDAWRYALENSSTSMNEEDIEVLKGFEKSLGKTDAEGQLSEIQLMEKYIDNQIEDAEEEQKINEKLYKNLGITVGLAIVIILF